jgi:hypothetical protein
MNTMSPCYFDGLRALSLTFNLEKMKGLKILTMLLINKFNDNPLKFPQVITC